MGKDEDRIRVPARIGNWLLDQNLGSGYSGSIWRASNPYTGQVAAVKVQDVDHECPTNRYERNFYPSLQGGKGMPTLWAAGVQGEYDYLVIDLLGASLDNLYRKNGKRFDLRTTICIALQVISRLEFMHSRGILHRDIQLGNCTLGLGKTENVIYMIDFGFSKRYIDPHTRKHIPDSKAKRDFIGNYWFSSVNVHCRGRVPSRRDDMEALALMLIHVLTDCGLPWTRNGVPKTDSAHDTLIRQKLRALPEDLCRGLPPVFEDFLRYCRRLKFSDQPDYNFWREQFELLAVAMDYVEPDGSVNDDFVWPPRRDETSRYMHTSPPRRRMSGGEVGLYDLLEEIAKMRLEDRKLVQPAKKRSDRKPPAEPKNSQTPPDPSSSNNVNENNRNDKLASREARPPPSQRESSGDTKGKPVQQLGVIVISDSSSDEDFKLSRRMARGTKQATLRLLTRRARSSTDNVALAGLLRQFIDTYSLTGTRSRIVTRDAFDFLDVVVHQLEDPSGALVHGSQPSTQSSGTFDSQTQNEETSQLESMNSRLRQRAPTQKTETVKALRLRLQSAPSAMTNAQLAKLLAEFCQAVRATSGKTLTKDGVAFLEGVELRLGQL